ncbi:MAG TPA: hypothetical protein DDX91_01755 [Ruminococcaceae bacterium]|nr:hypothetical protein [Oscillospiraceae bacterium]
MITGHNENLPKNNFKTLDELEERERLDNRSKDRAGSMGIDPHAILPYNQLFAYPFTNAGFPPIAVPFMISGDEEREDKRLSQ